MVQLFLVKVSAAAAETTVAVTSASSIFDMRHSRCVLAGRAPCWLRSSSQCGHTRAGRGCRFVLSRQLIQRHQQL